MEDVAAQGLSHAALGSREDAEQDADDQGVKSKSKKEKGKGTTKPGATAAADVLTNDEHTPVWDAAGAHQLLAGIPHCVLLPAAFKDVEGMSAGL